MGVVSLAFVEHQRHSDKPEGELGNLKRADRVVVRGAGEILLLLRVGRVHHYPDRNRDAQLADDLGELLARVRRHKTERPRECLKRGAAAPRGHRTQ